MVAKIRACKGLLIAFRKFIVAIGVVIFLVLPLGAIANPSAVEDMVARLQGALPFQSEELILTWMGHNSDHLALNPISNQRQELRFLLEFRPSGATVFEAGDIEIRLPRALFEDRDGNLIVDEYSMIIPLPEAPATSVATNYHFFIDENTNEIVITNFTAISEQAHLLQVEFLVSYVPSQSPDGFDNEFNATVTFAAGHGRPPVTSNDLSLDLTTRVRPANPTKMQTQIHGVWQSAWGVAPPASENYFFVRYRLNWGTMTTNPRTTQPFAVQLTEAPLDGGQIVAWTPVGNIILPSGYGFTRGNTIAFNAEAARTQNVPNPSTGGERWVQDVVVAFPRTGAAQQTVRNSFEVVYTPADHARDPVANPIITRQANASNTITVPSADGSDLRPSDNDFNDFENFGKRTGSVIRPGIFELEIGNQYNPFYGRADWVWHNPAGQPIRSFGIGNGPAIWSEVTAFHDTNNGTQPFRTSVIDDNIWLYTSTGWHRLNPGDYRFTQVRFNTFIEVVPTIGSNGLFAGTSTLPNAQRSPIRIYFMSPNASGWQFHGTIPLTGAATLNLPNQDIHAIKAVHTNGLYSVEFILAFDLVLNPTPRVLELIAGEDSVEVHNFAARIVEDYAGNQINPSPGGYPSAWPDQIAADDFEEHGRFLERSTDYSIMNREGYFHSGMTKALRPGETIQNDTVNARIVIPYRLTAWVDFPDRARPSTNAIFETLLTEQTQGVFYDLLPRGMTIDSDSIVARDAMGRTVTHSVVLTENWQDSGRTLVSIYVNATAGSNFRNNWSINAAQHLLRGTGFTVEFDVFYSWDAFHLFGGTSFRNIASYQSRSGALKSNIERNVFGSITGQPHSNSENTAHSINAAERILLSNFPRTEHIDPDELNTRSSLHTANPNFVTARQYGFSKMVRAANDSSYRLHTEVTSGGTYTYRLRYAKELGALPSSNVILFDVLEAAHQGNPHWRGTLMDVDVSHARDILGIAPVIYYSTVSGLNPMGDAAHANLANAAIWSTTAPSDRATITAVAIDLSTAANGQPFTFAPGSGTVVNLHMQAPHGIDEGILAYNRSHISFTTSAGSAWLQSLITTVEMRVREISLTKSSDPASGTQQAPTYVEADSDLIYNIRVTNSEDQAVEQVILADAIPAGLIFDIGDLQGFFGTAAPQPLADISRVNATVAGRTIIWTISTLGAGESFTLIVPTTVEEQTSRTVFENQARITSIGGAEHDIRSEITYHYTEGDDPPITPAGLVVQGLPWALTAATLTGLGVLLVAAHKRRKDVELGYAGNTIVCSRRLILYLRFLGFNK